MKLSAVLVSRNDNYGGHLIRTANYCLNSLLAVFDEVVYVDWNTEDGKPPLTDVCTIQDRSKLKVIVVSPEKAKQLCPEFHISEPIGRNIGIRKATGDVIVCTNVDMIPPSRGYLDMTLAMTLGENMLLTMMSNAVKIEDIEKHIGQNFSSSPHVAPIVFGAQSITARAMSPCLEVTSDTLSNVKPEQYHTVSSIIMACGDFQIAHRDTWFAVRGFEECMQKRGYIDTVVQYKIIRNGGTVRATNFPPVYTIEHERTSHLSNDPEFLPDVSTNSENWGLY
jgi:hypothetical protein